MDAWLTGAVPSPALLLRCAPVLQVSEDVLQETLEGKRDTYVWPLPKPPQDRLGRHGHDQDDEAERD
ncbi:MAG: hypothetical protein JO362_23095 [Streptomycetaceae bacterium]|nr:hypothetical protein [Streptomycetaceae bacterium]